MAAVLSSHDCVSDANHGITELMLPEASAKVRIDCSGQENHLEMGTWNHWYVPEERSRWPFFTDGLSKG